MRRKIIRIGVRTYQWVEAIFTYIACGIIMVMMFLTTADVAGRYLLNSPIAGAYEVTEAMLAGAVFLGIAFVQSQKAHVRVELVTSFLPGKAQLILNTFGFSVGFFIMAVITWQSGLLAWKAWVVMDHTRGVVEIPLWPGKSSVFFGAGLLCLRFIGDIISNFAHLLTGPTK